MIAVGVEYADPLTVQHGDLLILKENDVPGVAQQSGNIRCDEALAVPRAHDQRTVVPGAVQVARFVVAENAQRIAALQHSHSPNEGALHVAVIQPVQQMGNDLRVGLTDELRARLFQMAAQRRVVFNDAVMYHGDAALHVRMRMGVQVAGFPMGGPAGMADANSARNRAFLQKARQIFQPSLGLAHADLSVRADHCHSGAVISTIRKPLQPFHQNGRSVFRADISHNAAHGSSSFYFKTLYNIS